MNKTLDFIEDTNPTEFVLAERKHFLHIAKKYANSLKGETTRNSGKLDLSSTFVYEINNYRIILTYCSSKILPRASRLLNILLANMALAWENRRACEDMPYIADRVVIAYERLADYLETEEKRAKE